MSKLGTSVLAVSGMLLATACLDDTVTVDRMSAEDAARLEEAEKQSRDAQTPTHEIFSVIDAHESLPERFTNPHALVRAIGGTDGVALVGVKPRTAPRYADRITDSLGARKAAVFRVEEEEMVAARRELRLAGAEVLRTFRSLPLIVVRLNAELAPQLDSLPFVDYIEPNTEYRLAVSERSRRARPTNPPLAQAVPQNIRKVRASSAWGVGDGEGAWVVFLDGGLVGGASGHHRDLVTVDECWNAHSDTSVSDCTDNLGSSDPMYSHGTKVVGVAMADNNTSHVVGVAPGVDDWGMVRVCAPGCQTDAIVDALDSLANNRRKDIINMSLGGPTNNAALSTAVSAAWSSGDLLVGAAGNAGAERVDYPARYSNVIAVSGTTASDGYDNRSNYGVDVDVSAPYAVTTLRGTNTTTNDSGTSFSAPHVSGIAALIWARHPAWNNRSVRARIESAVEDLGIWRGWDSRFGYGRVDACFGVEAGCESIYELQASIVGDPTYRIPPGQTCEWQAFTEGGRLPLRYSWAGILSGSAASVSGQIEQGGLLRVTVTSRDGQVAVASINVTVDEDADDCQS